MACCPTEEKYGYEDCRFEKDVDEHFHCSICFNVPKDARMCKNNEHIFCAACISEHLRENSHTCPECSDHLTIDTLRRPRVLNNYLSKLEINCDYASRGCTEFNCVEDLESHVATCGFAPVLCSNQNCGLVIDKQEKVHHETVACEYRKCHDCAKIQEDVTALKESVREVKESLSRVNADVGEFKVMMTQILQKLDGLELVNKLPSSTAGMVSTSKEDILIAGGCLHSSAVFSWDKNGWFEISPMNEDHCIRPSSFIYNDQLFVLGGNTKTIETLDLNTLPLKWMKFREEIPYKICDSQIILCKQRVIHIGGYILDERKHFDVISEVQLASPWTMKQLCRMPEPRRRHGAEAFEDKILIMGGEDDDDHVLDGVLVFDPVKNECTEMPPLPRPLTSMATVRLRDQVVVLGGLSEDKKALKDVFMYNCKTGKTTSLPSMLEKRFDACAVVTGNAIVIMGGEDNDDFHRSVECFTIGDSAWRYLPAMNKDASWAVAEVLPSTKKYV